MLQVKKSTNLKLEKQTIAILKNNVRTQARVITITDDGGVGGILASIVEVCTSLTR